MPRWLECQSVRTPSLWQFDPGKGAYEVLGSADLSGASVAQRKWWGGALASNGKVYMMPNGAENMLEVTVIRARFICNRHNGESS